MVDDMPATGHPYAAEVLEMFAAEHPDTKVAKAARKAIHRPRSRT